MEGYSFSITGIKEYRQRDRKDIYRYHSVPDVQDAIKEFSNLGFISDGETQVDLFGDCIEVHKTEDEDKVNDLICYILSQRQITSVFSDADCSSTFMLLFTGIEKLDVSCYCEKEHLMTFLENNPGLKELRIRLPWLVVENAGLEDYIEIFNRTPNLQSIDFNICVAADLDILDIRDAVSAFIENIPSHLKSIELVVDDTQACLKDLTTYAPPQLQHCKIYGKYGPHLELGNCEEYAKSLAELVDKCPDMESFVCYDLGRYFTKDTFAGWKLLKHLTICITCGDHVPVLIETIERLRDIIEELVIDFDECLENFSGNYFNNIEQLGKLLSSLPRLRKLTISHRDGIGEPREIVSEMLDNSESIEYINLTALLERGERLDFLIDMPHSLRTLKINVGMISRKANREDIYEDIEQIIESAKKNSVDTIFNIDLDAERLREIEEKNIDEMHTRGCILKLERDHDIWLESDSEED